MIRSGRISATRHIRRALSAASVAPSRALHYGKSTTYRRLLTYDRSQHYLNYSPSASLLPSSATRSFVLRSHPLSIVRVLAQGRSLYASASRFQQPRAAEDVKDPPREDGNPEAKAEDVRKESS